MTSRGLSTGSLGILLDRHQLGADELPIQNGRPIFE